MSPGDDGPFRTPSPPDVRPEPPRSLGALRERFGPNRTRQLVIVPLLVVALAYVGGSLGGWRMGLSGGVAGLAIGLIMVVVMRRDRSGVALHEEGLVVRWPGGRTREIPFDEIDLLFISVMRSGLPFDLPVGNRIVVSTHDGERVMLPCPECLGPLVAPLQRRCTLPLVASAREALSEGELLRFGQLTIDRQGVAIGDARKGWSEITRASFDLDRLTLYETNGRVWQWLGIGTLPHVRALALVLEDVTRVEHLMPRYLSLFAKRQ